MPEVKITRWRKTPQGFKAQTFTYRWMWTGRWQWFLGWDQL